MLSISSAGAVDVSTQGELDAAIAANLNPINIVAGNLAVSAAQTIAPTTDLTVAAGASLNLANANNQTIGSLSGGGTVALGTKTLIAGGDGNSTAFSGVISGTGSFAKLGSGVLTIDNATLGAVSGSYIVHGSLAQTSGTTSAFYLAVGSGAGANGALLVSGGALNIAGDLSNLQVGDYGGVGTVTQTGGTIKLTNRAMNLGNQGGTGTYNISGGELDLTNPGGVANLNAIGRNTGANAGSTGTLNISGGVIDVSGTNNRLIIGYGGSTAQQSQGVITQTGGVLRVHTGSTLNLSGLNSSTGVYNLNGGALEIGGSSLQASYNNANPHYQFNLGGGTIKVIETALVANLNATLTGGVSTIDTNGLGATWTGVLSGSGALAKAGVGTLTLSGSNVYTGATLVNGGTLRAGSAGAFASTSAFTVASGATLDLNGFSQTIGSLAGGGVVNVGTNNLTVGGDGSSTAFSGTINMTNQGYGSSPYGTFTKTGAGTLTIDNATIQLGESYIVQGAMAQTSGTTAVTYLAVGEGAVGGTPNVGALIVSGGTITFGTQLQVGDFGGAGTVTQTGGTVKVVAQCGDLTHCAALNIGNQGGNGVYNISGGELDLTASLNTIGRSTGNHAGSTGALNISGGLVDLSNNSGGGGGLIIGYGNISAFSAQSSGTITQTGGVLRIESGSTLYLSGYNTSTGVYNLNGGALQVGDAGLQASYGNGAGDYHFNLGGGSIQVIGSALTTNVNATLTAGSTSTIDTNGLGATFSGVLSGGGALAKIGAGTLVLSGVNTYAGGTTIGDGVLQATNNSSVGTGVVTLNGGAFQAGANGLTVANNFALAGAANVIDTQNFALTLSGGVSGAGGLTKIGAGILTLSGSDTYLGATLVSAGTLRAGAANAFSTSSAFTIASGATLNLNSFNQTIGSLAGGGNVALGSAVLTVGGDNSSTTFSGNISSPVLGELSKIGTGVLTLTGASVYRGATTVYGGVLDVEGSLTSTVTVENGASLMGSGTIGGLNVVAGGTVAPGNASIGTLNAAGVAFLSGSTYQVEANAAGQADKIAATGAATLTGGAVQVLAENGNYGSTTKYTILTAAGGVTGEFASVVSDLAFLTPKLSYDANDVFLTLSRNTTYFTNVAQTRNQRAVAAALDASSLGSALVQAVLFQNAAGAQQAFTALSGEIYGSAQTTMIDDSRYVRQALLGRMRQASFEDQSGPMTALTTAGPTLAYADTTPALSNPINGHVDAGRLFVGAPAPSRAFDTVWWAQGVGAWGRIEGDGNAAEISRDLRGFFTGVDQRFGDNWRAGLASGYVNSSLSISARASSANIDTAHAAAYAVGTYGAWSLRSGGDFAWNMVGANRSIQFPGFVDYTTAHYNARLAQLFSELGYSVALGDLAAEPFAGLAWVHLNTDGFRESGGVAALYGAGNTEDVGYSTLGTRMASNYLMPNSMVLSPHVSVAWQHAFGDVTPTAALAFQNTGAAFLIAGAPLARDAALIEAGIELHIAPLATIGVSYAAQLANRAQDQSAKGSLNWKF
ncbi:autotransporter domain-containing protein [Methylocapsa acidiphila]|uniref:autotransporter domain-containing protein n=1 Tax=Methylocapsa acidiphila TaxID=133552 RepID=UPI00047A55A4|nr:autotransporter domain-containing protein [Methylocapsa acidiphila]